MDVHAEDTNILAERKYTLCHVTTGEQKQDILEAFQLSDRDIDGFLSFHEFKVSLRALGFQIKTESLRELMTKYNFPLDETRFNFNDFSEIASDFFSQKDPKEDLIKAFNLIDEEKSGEITYNNLRKAVRELSEPLSDEDLKAMIEEFDQDGSCSIKLDKFLSIMS
ncbi:Centrin-3 [Cichlidogyrus casuarinus]|uniref:Centrin-3 n=1 Tax=Cichlidogyrus casuarinus TaxID=1844966 RepID=A0ABD2QBF6_9PLAT